jgi:hypothetical protein
VRVSLTLLLAICLVVLQPARAFAQGLDPLPQTITLGLDSSPADDEAIKEGTWALSLIWPGLGHIFMGEPLKGVVYAATTLPNVLAWTLIGALVSLLPNVVSPASAPPPNPQGFMVGGAVIGYLMLVGFSATDAWQVEQTRLKGRPSSPQDERRQVPSGSGLAW